MNISVSLADNVLCPYLLNQTGNLQTVLEIIPNTYEADIEIADSQALKDLFAVALREAKEESGITELAPFSQDILALDILPVPAHIKRGKPVKEHEHLNVTYLFIAPTDQTLTVKADENSAVAWIPIADLPKVVSEARMLPVYEKLIARSRQWKAEALREKEPR